jgi:hypothetical protein
MKIMAMAQRLHSSAGGWSAPSSGLIKGAPITSASVRQDGYAISKAGGRLVNLEHGAISMHGKRPVVRYGVHGRVNRRRPVLADQKPHLSAELINGSIVQTTSPRLDGPIAAEEGFDSGGQIVHRCTCRRPAYAAPGMRRGFGEGVFFRGGALDFHSYFGMPCTVMTVRPG